MSRLLTSLHGRKIGLDDAGRLIVPAGIVAGDHGSQVLLPSPSTVVQFDDFVGDTINTDLYANPTKGSDAATVDFAVLTNQLGGWLRGTTGAGAGGTMAVNGIQIYGNKNWQANNGNLGFETRLKLSAITNVCLFAGLSSTSAATLEAPFTIAGATVTSSAVDAVGFVFDTAATASTFKLLGVANNVDATLQEAVQSTLTLTTAPVAATFITLRVEVDKLGVATFFINGKSVGTRMTGAVTANLTLAPTISVFTRTAASLTCDVDYLTVHSNRV